MQPKHSLFRLKLDDINTTAWSRPLSNHSSLLIIYQREIGSIMKTTCVRLYVFQVLNRSPRHRMSRVLQNFVDRGLLKPNIIGFQSPRCPSHKLLIMHRVKHAPPPRGAGGAAPSPALPTPRTRICTLLYLSPDALQFRACQQHEWDGMITISGSDT